MKKKVKIITLISSIIIIFLFALFWFFILRKTDNLNSKEFIKNISALNENTSTVEINKLTNFEWDIMYVFRPYLSKSEIENIIGFKSNDITEVLDEGIVHIMFLKSNKIVCNISKRNSVVKFNIIDNEKQNYDYLKYDYSDNVVFNINHNNNYKYLSPVVDN